MNLDIYAADEQSEYTIDLARWSALCEAALADQGVRGPAEVSLLFIEEAPMAELNREFMGKSGPTDVLSFPIDAEEPESGRSPDAGSTGPGQAVTREIPQMVGDIVLCPSVAARNAVAHECTFDDEVALLIVHGVLHLLGWDHMENDEAERMEALERDILARHYRSAQ